MNNNKIQSIHMLKMFSDLRNLKLKFESFSCKVFEGNGHDYDFINSFAILNLYPKVMIVIQLRAMAFLWRHTSTD